MIKLTDNLYNYIFDNCNISNISGNLFSNEQLNQVRELSIVKSDIRYLGLFSNLESLKISSFPSITSDDLNKIAELCPNIKRLYISEQSALIDISLKNYTNLSDITIISCVNLKSINNLNEIINLSKFVLYDNKSYENYDYVFECILKNENCYVELDIDQYFPLSNYLLKNKLNKNIIEKVCWVENLGLRKKSYFKYEVNEMNKIRDTILKISSKYIFKSDGDMEKFGILYRWMIKNISFINEDENEDLICEYNNVYDVFSNFYGGRLSYAKAFQVMLSAVGIKSTIVYSLGALDDIGKYDGELVYSLIGLSDYALLRVSLNDRYYYLDVAWDSLVYKYNYYDSLRLFLVSKDELMLRHKIVGEGNIGKTHSYHGDDSDDLNIFAEDRIQYVDSLFSKIKIYDANIDGIMMNISFYKKELDDLKENGYAFNKKITEINCELESQEKKLSNYRFIKNNIIRKYIDDIRFHYLNGNEKNTSLMSLNETRNYSLISAEMYELLRIVLE